jgi:hypothetical protein
VAGICDLPVISNVCQSVGQAGATLVEAPFDWLAQAMASAASWMYQGVWALFDSTTRVDLGQAGYLSVYDVMFGIAVFIMLIFFSLQLITGMIRRDHGALTRAALGLARSVLGSFVLVTLTTLLLTLVDKLCTGIIQATGNTLDSMGVKIAALVAGLATINVAAPGAGAIVTIFLSFLALSAAAIVWFTLLIRKALILVAVVLGPIALSGSSWDATKGWFSKWASFLLALIVSKLVVVLVFLVAINQINAPIDLDLSSIADPVAGIVLMFIAAFAPYMVYKFIAFAGIDPYHLAAAEQESKQAMNRPLPSLSKPTGQDPKKILSSDDSTPGSSPSQPGSPPSTSGGPEQPANTAASSPVPGAAAGGDAAGATAAEGAGAEAAGGPIGIAAVEGAKLAKDTAEAGPKLGGAVGQTADQHAAAASESSSTPPAGAAQAPAMTPATPPSTGGPPAPATPEAPAPEAPHTSPSPPPQPSNGGTPPSPPEGR